MQVCWSFCQVSMIKTRLDTSWSVFSFYGQIEWVGQFWIWFQNCQNLSLGTTSWHWQLQSHFKCSKTLVKHKLSRSRNGLAPVCLLKSRPRISRSPEEKTNGLLLLFWVWKCAKLMLQLIKHCQTDTVHQREICSTPKSSIPLAASWAL